MAGVMRYGVGGREGHQWEQAQQASAVNDWPGVCLAFVVSVENSYFTSALS